MAGKALAKRKPASRESASKEIRKSDIQDSTRRSVSDLSASHTRLQRTRSKRCADDSRDRVFQERRFFTLSEDSIILCHWLQHKGAKTVIQISQTLSRELPHSTESIRDRIKRYLSRVSNFDQEYIIDEATVTYDYFATY